MKHSVNFGSGTGKMGQVSIRSNKIWDLQDISSDSQLRQTALRMARHGDMDRLVWTGGAKAHLRYEVSTRTRRAPKVNIPDEHITFAHMFASVLSRHPSTYDVRAVGTLRERARNGEGEFLSIQCSNEHFVIEHVSYPHNIRDMREVGRARAHEVALRGRKVYSHVEVVAHSREVRMRYLSDDKNDILEGPVAALIAYAREAYACARPPAWRNLDVDLDELRTAPAPRPGDAVMMGRAIVKILERKRKREDPIWHQSVWHPERAQR